MTETIGMLGIGIMGSAMARNLIKAGFAVVGYDPVPAARDRLIDMGGRALSSPKDVVETAAISFASLPSAVALAEAAAVVAGAGGSGQILIECSTLPLSAKRNALAEIENAGKILLDCPVSGTGAQAATGDLVILGSGDEQAFKRCGPAFAGMSRRQVYLGRFGTGSIMKYIANHLVTIHNAAAAEAMLLGMKAGIDPGLIYDTLADSAGTSRMFQMRGPLMRDETYDNPTATIRTHLKDLSIISGFAAELGCMLPVYAAAEQLYHAGEELGFAARDTAAICAVLERMNGFDRPSGADAPIGSSSQS
ncbi:NAD(P)-dependent oxidoreductase [Bradyrhizobium commune]|uniref:NAD(P)-dependent oxidoreductase n=1 Tax=Bradyrhizobium commune TaxID=83627 RepID=A0A7S9H0X4_9BRAD|nr:NAD(P)-dependent oxidoreductase [Bradyrhizobium commune]QPF93074.1 NAD(P)-dependent oxidoreductase [Bradyrhizobium commune]